MPVDPFAALGIDQSSLPPPAVAANPDHIPQPAPQQKDSSGPDPFAALGVDTSQQFAPTPTAQQKQNAHSTLGDIGTQLRVGVERGITGIANALIPPNPFSLQVTAPPIFNAHVPDIEPNAPEPKDFAGRAARRIGEFVPGAALGGGGVVRQGLMTLGGGIGSQLAEDAAPDSLKPLAATAGGIVGGGLAGEGANAVAKGAQAASEAGGRLGFSRPTWLGGEGQQTIGGIKASPTQVQAAGGQVKGALGEQGVQNLQTAPEVLVPGSQPTTAQVAMTPGAATLEKAHRTATPEPFLARQTEQNSARLAQVQGLAPENAQPGAVGQFFQQQLNALDQQGQQAVQQARTGVQQAVEGAGQSLQQQAANFDRAGQQAVQQARTGVQRATGALGGTQTTGAYGDQARAALQAARDPVHAQTQALWDAVDPDRTWTLPVGQARETAGQLIQEISPTAQTDAQESALLQRAAQMPDVVGFRALSDMRADTNAAMRRLSGTPGYEPNVRRLTLLKQSIDNSISDALDGRAAQEAQAVAAGQISPEQTLAANLQRSVEDWRANRATTNQQASANSGGSFGSNADNGSAAVPGVGGTASQTVSGSANAPRPAGISGQAQPLEPNLTQEHADAYRAAVNATREEKQRFGQGGVGKTLRPGKNGEEFAVQSGKVPSQIFTRGPTEPQEVQRFIEAVGGPNRAAQIGRETLANELRQRGIVRLDGTIDPNQFADWLAKRQATISQFPGLSDQFANAARAQETLDNVLNTHSAAQDARNTIINEFRQGNIIDPDGTINAAKFARWRARRSDIIQQFPGLGDQFANAETAQRTLDDVTATHKAALDDFQKSAAAKFINNDPAKAVQQAFSSGNPTATFTQLVRQVRGNADAEAGLKRAVVDYITEKTRSATPANSAEDFQKAATFRNFIRQNNGALKALFGGQGVQNLDMVAADLRRAAQQTTAVAGSDTAANIAAAKKTGLAKHAKEASPSILMLLGEQMGEHLHGGLLGMAGGAVMGGIVLPKLANVISSMRQAGIDNINALVREAMLHPQLARELVSKVQAGNSTTIAHRIARAIQTTVLAQTAAQQDKQ